MNELHSNVAKNPRAIIALGPHAIRERLNELDKEWDIDRAVELIFSGLIFAQLVTAVKKNKKGRLFGPLLQSSFLLLHTVFGWSPQIPLLRELGFRTRLEIKAERERLLNALYKEEWEYEERSAMMEWDVYGSV
ncbi:MAG: hypothetical protein ACXVLQ_10890 [Bacteriovorax sp.]